MNVFEEIKFWLKLKPILEREQSLMRAKLSSTTIIQMLLGVCDILNLMMPSLSGKNQVLAGSALGILHVVVNTISHLSNPDGTDVKIAYTPSK